MTRFYLFLVFLYFGIGCKPAPEENIEFSSQHINDVIQTMTDIMVRDVTNPPLAARFFSYACLAGYEVVSQNDSSFKSMYGLLNDYPKIDKPENVSSVSFQLSAILAMMETAKAIQPTGSSFEDFQKDFLDSCRRSGISGKVIDQSLLYAQEVSKGILLYAKNDRYNKTSNYPRYSPVKEEGTWYPTPPGFFAPVEPYFNTLRPFTLDTCNQFRPLPPVPFSSIKGSEFYELMENCYKEGRNLGVEEKSIAAFWDCNPFALEEKGHMMVGMKKISPGAHWMGITGIACKQAKVGFAKALKINTMVAISMMDGFISCWDEKFRSNRIRPETAIRKYLDPSWHPLLQTPPFPEYLSGHSTVSSASAVILTHYFGDDFKYTDT
nr:vanadium-dependent haloperoxidase [Bacteroidota bacterium]